MTMILSYEYQLQTSYSKTFNQTSTCESAIERVDGFIDEIGRFVNSHTLYIGASSTVASLITTNNAFKTLMQNLITAYGKLTKITYQGYTTDIFALTNDLCADLRQVFYMMGFDNYALKPIRALYVHLKKINKSMNLYEFKQWLSCINYLQITELNDVLATNPTGIVPSNMFPKYAEMFAVYITQASDQFAVVENLIDSLDHSFWNGHMLPIANFCIDVCNTYTFDLFAIKSGQ